MSINDNTVQEKPLSDEDRLEIYLAARKEMRAAGQEEMIKNVIAAKCVQGVSDFLMILESEAYQKYGCAILQFPPLAEQELPQNMLLQPEEITMMETQILSNLKQMLSIMGLENRIRIEVTSC